MKLDRETKNTLLVMVLAYAMLTVLEGTSTTFQAFMFQGVCGLRWFASVITGKPHFPTNPDHFKPSFHLNLPVLGMILSAFAVAYNSAAIESRRKPTPTKEL